MAGLFGIAGALAGMAGDKPKVPDFQKLDLGSEQEKAISANLASQGRAQQLASGVNLFNQQELMAMLTRGIPGYQALQDQESKTIMSMVRGEIPDANRVATSSAAKALGLGISGSKGAADLGMRDLGIASLAATEAGLSAADRWMRTTDAMTNPGLFNVSSMFVSPAQQMAADVEERNAAFNVDWLKNRIEAMPGPVEQEVMGTLDYFDSLGKSALSAYAGGAIGGMGGGGASGGSGQPSTMQFGAGVGANTGLASSPYALGGYQFGAPMY